MSNEELAVRIQSGETELYGELWDQVAGLIKWKANRVMTSLELQRNSCGVEFDDLCQCGYLALAAAVADYRPGGGSFNTLFMYRLKMVFAEATGYRTKRGKHEPLNNAASLDKTVDDETDGTPLGEFVPDPKAAATMAAVEEREFRWQLHEAIEAALATIPEPYSEVLRLRHYQGLSLAEVGDIRGVGAERVRQMENKAIRQLRKPSIACHLRPFCDFDFYCGTGMGAFRNSGISIQERYLLLEEERQERAKEREQRAREKQIRGNYEAAMEHIRQEADERISRMSSEEKEQLLKQYGSA